MPIMRDFVSFSIPGPCTRAQAVRKVAEQCGWRLAPLPEEFKRKRHIRGIAVFEPAGEYLDRITLEHENLCWDVSGGVLRFEMGSPSFSGLLGRLTHEARERNNGRLPDADKHRIAAELDARGFPYLEQFRMGTRRRFRENQALYNQTNHKKPILTFAQALNTRWAYMSSGQRFSPRRAVLRRFYDAERKYTKAPAIRQDR
jgi:hypothetical protein